MYIVRFTCICISFFPSSMNLGPSSHVLTWWWFGGVLHLFLTLASFRTWKHIHPKTQELVHKYENHSSICGQGNQSATVMVHRSIINKACGSVILQSHTWAAMSQICVSRFILLLFHSSWAASILFLRSSVSLLEA